MRTWGPSPERAEIPSCVVFLTHELPKVFNDLLARPHLVLGGPQDLDRLGQASDLHVSSGAAAGKGHQPEVAHDLLDGGYVRHAPEPARISSQTFERVPDGLGPHSFPVRPGPLP